ncbi:DUF559 domain-containing protein [Galbitalea sp. SE-J8]|uniref:endonuclease domain-containing protein n=1 Tax=Galbitalea sp. SE-J8 TaxID=3054952 RepID=UPI00259C7A67|nr:DUF559 domain-containing protein [Galbitalea sp. SE-J8]MDM4762565.1 DUF559 domain-containing protein [Galbitalea sp. SE-J8]
MTLHDVITRFHGIVATHELLAAGWSEGGIRWALKLGVISRIRKGWYCEPHLHPDVQRAARVGGRLTCESLAVRLALWVPETDGRLHVAVLPDRTQLRRHDRHDVRLSERPDARVVVHWTSRRTGSRIHVDIIDMVVDLCDCRPPWFVFIVAESALNRGNLSRGELERSLDRVPPSHRRLLGVAGVLSESGGESAFALILIELGFEVVQQVWIGRDRVDFLVGERLVVEIDGRAYHDRARDNRRDGRLIRARMHVLHFDSDMVLHERDDVVATFLAAIARNEHRA